MCSSLLLALLLIAVDCGPVVHCYNSCAEKELKVAKIDNSTEDGVEDLWILVWSILA